MTKYDREKLLEIENKLPFHYDDRPTITKQDIGFLIAVIHRLTADRKQHDEN